MGRKKIPGLYKRNGYWYVDKRIFGIRVSGNTGADSLEEAEKYIARTIDNLRQAKIYGTRPNRIFRQAMVKYLTENQDKASIETDIALLKKIDNFIGDLPLEQVHIGTLQTFIKARKDEGRKHKTINLALACVRHILNLAASEWLDENGLTWLAAAPKIKLLPTLDARAPYPLSWDEQKRLFDELPLHLRRMALFKVNTGCREREVCQLRWEWEIQLSELGTSVFIIPKQFVKNREERLIVLNKTAKSVIDEVRGIHKEVVFTYLNNPIAGMNNKAWIRARKKVGLTQVRIHDLKHTFGRRLRAAGVSFEDRQDLLGHRSGRITTHYSRAELFKLIEAANKVCDVDGQNPALTLLRSPGINRQADNGISHRSPTNIINLVEAKLSRRLK